MPTRLASQARPAASLQDRSGRSGHAFNKDNRDIVVVQTVTMLAAGVYVFLNLAADLATIMVTPRLRTAGR